MTKIEKYSNVELKYLQNKIYEAFPPHLPNRPIFDPQNRQHFGVDSETERAEIILSESREKIDWMAYSEISLDSPFYIFMFSIDFYKYAFPSLLSFCISPESVLPNNGIHILKGTFLFHLDAEELATDWELEFLLSLNPKQSNIVANVLKISGENLALERYWGGYL